VKLHNSTCSALYFNKNIRNCNLFLCAFLLLLISKSDLLAAPEAKVTYHEVWHREPLVGIQFVSPEKGWLGVRGLNDSADKNKQPYLLTTDRGISFFHPVSSLSLPSNYFLDSFTFLNKDFGLVVSSEITGDLGNTRLFRTDDGGQTWRELAHNLPKGRNWKVQFNTPNLGWMLMGDLFRTEDGGVTWNKIAAPIEASKIYFISAAEGWLIGEGAIFHTDDSGQTWKQQYRTSQGMKPYLASICFIPPAEGWVAGDGKLLLHTVDGGNSWKQVNPSSHLMGPYDNFESVYFISSEIGVVSGRHYEGDLLSRKELKGLSPVSLDFDRPYLLVTFDGGRSWAYHKMSIPVGAWSQVGSILFGINTVNFNSKESGIEEVQLGQGSKFGARKKEQADID